MEKYLIYDDNSGHAMKLKLLLSDIIPMVETDVSSDLNTTKKLLDNNSYSVIFIDIELEDDINGIYVADDLQRNGLSADLVYITAHTKYYEELFITRPTAFIEKPFTAEKVRRVLDIIEKKRNREDYLSISISTNSIERIPLKDTAWIEYYRRYLIFYNSDGEKISEYYGKKLSELDGKLPPYFIRCHQSFYVNMNYVTGIKRFCFILDINHYDKEKPISQPRFKEVKKMYLDYLGSTI